MSCSDDEVLSYSKLLLIKNSFPTPATGSCSVSLSARLKQSLQLSVTIQVALGCNQTTFCLLFSLDLSQVHFSLQHIFLCFFIVKSLKNINTSVRSLTPTCFLSPTILSPMIHRNTWITETSLDYEHTPAEEYFETKS